MGHSTASTLLNMCYVHLYLLLSKLSCDIVDNVVVLRNKWIYINTLDNIQYLSCVSSDSRITILMVDTICNSCIIIKHHFKL